MVKVLIGTLGVVCLVGSATLVVTLGDYRTRVWSLGSYVSATQHLVSSTHSSESECEQLALNAVNEHMSDNAYCVEVVAGSDPTHLSLSN